MTAEVVSSLVKFLTDNAPGAASVVPWEGGDVFEHDEAWMVVMEDAADVIEEVAASEVVVEALFLAREREGLTWEASA